MNVVQYQGVAIALHDADRDGDIASFLTGVPFAAVLPACGDPLQRFNSVLVERLLELGCQEIVCVGPDACSLEDELDAFLEDGGRIDVVTTAFEDAAEAVEYVVFGLRLVTRQVVSVIGRCTDFHAELVRLAAQDNDP